MSSSTRQANPLQYVASVSSIFVLDYYGQLATLAGNLLPPYLAVPYGHAYTTIP